ncbi:MAG: AraC family transcriptional regulator [Acidobacteriota bacterium]
MDKRIAAAIDYISENIHQQLSVDEIAHHVNLSSSRLRHLFKNETGESIYHYIRRLRMEAARELLETSFLTTKQVMCKVGINDESRFTRDFKSLFGCSPGCHRASCKSTSDQRKVKIANK